jgi:hypothetical protein
LRDGVFSEEKCQESAVNIFMCKDEKILIVMFNIIVGVIGLIKTAGTFQEPFHIKKSCVYVHKKAYFSENCASLLKFTMHLRHI